MTKVTAMLPRSAPDRTDASVSGGSASGGSVHGDAALGAAVSGGTASGGDASSAVTGAGAIDAPLADVDATFVDIVLRIARAALPLHALAIPHTWTEEQTAAWISALAAFSTRVAPALDIGGAALIIVVHDILALPATILVPFLERSAVKSPQLKAFLAELAYDGNPLAYPRTSLLLPAARALLSRGYAGGGKEQRSGRSSAAVSPTSIHVPSSSCARCTPLPGALSRPLKTLAPALRLPQ